LPSAREWRTPFADRPGVKETVLDVTAAAHAAALWAGLNLLILLVLSLLVVRQRQRHKVVFGDGGGDAPDLARAIRAFGNAAEYIPTGVAGLGVLALAGGRAFEIYLIGFVLVLGRLAHAVGLSREAGASKLRSAGMVLTWVAYILTAVALLISAMG
jgi:uncharacterized membrane protein YecN with MAPEG domain